MHMGLLPFGSSVLALSQTDHLLVPLLLDHLYDLLGWNMLLYLAILTVFILLAFLHHFLSLGYLSFSLYCLEVVYL